MIKKEIKDQCIAEYPFMQNIISEVEQKVDAGQKELDKVKQDFGDIVQKNIEKFGVDDYKRIYTVADLYLKYRINQLLNDEFPVDKYSSYVDEELFKNSYGYY